MKATEATLLKFLKNAPQFIIPIYQRNYSWTQEQCNQLWMDLLRAGRDKKISSHFIGSIVYIERGLSTVVQQESLLVIDGQQRLTTATLLIAALADYFEANDIAELMDVFSARKLRNYYLLNPEEDGDRRFKLLLSETDKDTLLAILRKAPTPDPSSARIEQNFKLFQQLIETNKAELEAICTGLDKLVIVDVALDRTQDNPQLIFESMNSTGLELSQADLIRNYILMGLEPALQTELYTTYWRPMERGFGQAGYTTHFDGFMRHYLTTKTGEIPNVREVYTAFKLYARGRTGDTRELVAEIHAYAGYYCAMALGTEQHPLLRQAFQDLREQKRDVVYPFLLDAYHDYRIGDLSAEELYQALRLVESYVFRRAVCAIPTNSLNRTFAGLSRSLKKDRYLESLKATFLLLPSYRRFPDDDEFQREIKVRNLYKFRNLMYWLRKLENFNRKEPITVENYTVEHILPQNPELSTAWKQELGPEYERIQQTWLHTLGNLTLTGYNSEYSDRPFKYKRDDVTNHDGDPVGLKVSPLMLNQGLGSVETWDENAIRQRADRLAVRAAKVWQAPELAADVLNAYRPAATQGGQTYGIDDHHQLASGPARELFEQLRGQVLALDPCVSEEFLKVYVAYKAETNFVDVIPQAKRLLLTLNIPFHEIDDPNGLCRDITGLGRWGNGDVEVKLESPDQLPYVLGLIRQAFDQQMGSVDA
ncbi:uncharacterized protein with ParB-like and HNH nuclease domain/predicted transport protein [Rhodanobacter sp. TND4EL1]